MVAPDRELGAPRADSNRAIARLNRRTAARTGRRNTGVGIGGSSWLGSGRWSGTEAGDFALTVHPPADSTAGPAVRSASRLSPRAPVAQWTERRASNSRVAGSNPAGGATRH